MSQPDPAVDSAEALARQRIVMDYPVELLREPDRESDDDVTAAEDA